MLDPYVKMSNRLPGAMCEVNYQCKSDYCNLDLHICQVLNLNNIDSDVASLTKNLCSQHDECDVGYFCAKIHND